MPTVSLAAGFPDPRWILLAWLGGGLFVAMMPCLRSSWARQSAGGRLFHHRPRHRSAQRFSDRLGDWCQLTVSTGFITVAFGEYVHRLGLLGLTAADRHRAGGRLLPGKLITARAARRNIGSALKRLVWWCWWPLCLAGAARHDRRARRRLHLRRHDRLARIYGAWWRLAGGDLFSEEVNAPERNVARATFVGIAVITTLYLLSMPRTACAAHGPWCNLRRRDAARIVLGISGVMSPRWPSCAWRAWPTSRSWN